ncbi:MAG: alkaline phosphatase family protein [Bacteroidetes bacterium]|nr:alkaline phosphatase family protein [Bacteroidota bacterium]
MYRLVNLLFGLLFLMLLNACSTTSNSVGIQDPSAFTIAFGSCAHQDKPQPVLSLAASYQPDLFIFLGDNIYGDTDDMNVLRHKYNKWMCGNEYKELKKSSRIMATWDDHDYGRNDAGRHYSKKRESKKLFLDYFGEAEDSERRGHDGIYHAEIIKWEGKLIQVILLDTRSFRDDLLPYHDNHDGDKRFHYRMDYAPYETGDSTLLGKAQWEWLEHQLRDTADIRIIATSTQFGITHNGYEAWANFPHEQQKMLEIINSTAANGVVFISGDVHYGEISRIDENGKTYPIYDITSSGITQSWRFATPNENRIKGPVMQNHFGLLELDLNARIPVIRAKIIDKKNRIRVLSTISLNEISFY